VFKEETMKDGDPIIRVAVMLSVLIVIAVGLIAAIYLQQGLIFVGILIPLITFFVVFVLMSVQKKKIQGLLNESFGANVVKISTAIMEYFELPLTLLLSISLTMFFFAFSVLAVLFWFKVHSLM
jgi:hypothetical protein